MIDTETRVLLIDDERFIVTILLDLLRKEGYDNVEFAKSGNEALKKIPLFKPNVVFLDIEMPELDDFTTLAAIKEFGINTQVVMISGTPTAARVEAAKKGGAAGFIVKPVTPKRIGDAMRICLERARHEEGDIELFVF